VKRWFFARTVMGSTPWPVPVLDDLADLRGMLGLSTGNLGWFSDTKQLEHTARDERLRHYRYRWVQKASGGVRMIEEPKPLLKHFQRVVLREILDKIPAHEAAQGFCRGRSAVSYAAGHAGQSVLFHVDLEDFFGSIAAGRVFGILRRCGYPEPVAHVLTGLVTNTVPPAVQGAPRRSNLPGQRSEPGARPTTARCLRTYRLEPSRRALGLASCPSPRYLAPL
jgi:hypothetical protein